MKLFSSLVLSLILFGVLALPGHSYVVSFVPHYMTADYAINFRYHPDPSYWVYLSPVPTMETDIVHVSQAPFCSWDFDVTVDGPNHPFATRISLNPRWGHRSLYVTRFPSPAFRQVFITRSPVDSGLAHYRICSPPWIFLSDWHILAIYAYLTGF